MAYWIVAFLLPLLLLYVNCEPATAQQPVKNGKDSNNFTNLLNQIIEFNIKEKQAPQNAADEILDLSISQFELYPEYAQWYSPFSIQGNYPQYPAPVGSLIHPVSPLPQFRASLLGKWLWLGDGVNQSGDVVLRPRGILTHDWDWTGGMWKLLENEQVYMEFNGIGHVLSLTDDKRAMVQITPLTFPPAIVQFDSELPPEHASDILSITHDQSTRDMNAYNLENFKASISSQYTAADGGSTGKEGITNLLNSGEQDWNKWYQRDSNRSWIMIDLQGIRLPLHGIGFKSANDESKRDPDVAKILIFDDARNSWIHISTLHLNFEGDRWRTLRYKIPSCMTSAIVIDLENYKRTSMQLGETKSNQVMINRTQYHIAAFLLRNKKFKESKKLAKQVLIFAQAQGFLGLEGKCLWLLGCCYYDLRKKPRSYEFFTRSKEWHEKDRNLYGQAVVIINLGNEQKESQDLEFYREGIRIAQEIKYSRQISRGLRLIGECYIDKKDYETATKYITESLEVWKKLDTFEERARNLAVFGRIAYRKKDYDEAIEFYNSVISLYMKYNDLRGQRFYLRQQTNVYNDKQDHRSAIRNMEESLRISSDQNDLGQKVEDLKMLSHCFYEDGQYRKSLMTAKKHLKLCENKLERTMVRQCYYNLGINYSQLSKYKKAIVQFEKGISVSPRLEESIDLPKKRKIDSQMPMPAKKLKTNEESSMATSPDKLQNFESEGYSDGRSQHVWYIDNVTQIAFAYLQIGDFRKAYAYFTKSKALVESVDFDGKEAYVAYLVEIIQDTYNEANN